MRDNQLGLVQVYTGSGKGKTTAAMGLALRAVGHRFRVHIIQYLKGSSYAGELFSLQRLLPYVTIAQFGRGCPYSALIRQGMKNCTGCGQCFIKNGQPSEEDFELTSLALAESRKAVTSGDYDMVILDEIGNALRYNLVTVEQVTELIKSKRPGVELILTGRGIPKEVLALADLVSEIQEVKHPYKAGIGSRRGSEY
ncbi:MAG: cob(I)yrinic acid a,c-diamide adenosyltransferase [Thermincolia bacterium]